MSDARYIYIVTTEGFSDLIGQVNKKCAQPTTDEGWPYGEPSYNLVAFVSDRIAVLEKV